MDDRGSRAASEAVASDFVVKMSVKTKERSGRKAKSVAWEKHTSTGRDKEREASSRTASGTKDKDASPGSGGGAAKEDVMRVPLPEAPNGALLDLLEEMRFAHAARTDRDRQAVGAVEAATSATSVGMEMERGAVTTAATTAASSSSSSSACGRVPAYMSLLRCVHPTTAFDTCRCRPSGRRSCHRCR